ncbi:MAG TPA: hypothetical protein VHO03_16980 [Ignavibacteriales bacterium]|nr:hypothetical protein [Ignavibacteriales bacterium]
MPFFGKKRKNLERLIELSEKEQLRDEEFYKLAVKARKDIVLWWKKKYNYSRTDPRYLNATQTEIYEDFLEWIIDKYNKEYANDPLAERILRGREKNPDFDLEETERLEKENRETEQRELEKLNGRQ